MLCIWINKALYSYSYLCYMYQLVIRNSEYITTFDKIHIAISDEDAKSVFMIQST